MNLISLKLPNGTIENINKAMTNNEQSFNFSYIPSLSGEYSFTTCGDPNGRNICDSDSFQVTHTGKELQQSQSTIYITIVFLLLLMFIGFIVMGIKLPYNNNRDELSGYILSVNNLKYLKQLMFAFSYLTLLVLSYMSWMLSYAYLDFNFITSLSKFVFYFLVALVLPLFILYVYLNIANFIRDQKLKDFLERGLSVR